MAASIDDIKQAVEAGDMAEAVRLGQLLQRDRQDRKAEIEAHLKAITEEQTAVGSLVYRASRELLSGLGVHITQAQPGAPTMARTRQGKSGQPYTPDEAKTLLAEIPGLVGKSEAKATPTKDIAQAVGLPSAKVRAILTGPEAEAQGVRRVAAESGPWPLFWHE